jgi:hypothetical protein
MVEAWVAGLMEMPVGFMNICIDLAGTAVAFTVANVDERDVVPNLYGTIRGLLIGDKGFISGDSSQPRRSMRSQVS